MQRKLISSDPQRPATLARLRQIWRHLPPNRVLLFFDVKPIPVKAYGGRRYSSARRLILQRYQKTRGLFYLFALDDARHGRVRWAFMEGKSSHFVGQFMHLVRRWYPEQVVWVALDQDRSHPRKSRETRRTMRSLKLRWVSLPQGSPDDNPVETIFSDVQLRILDNSDDADVKATQRRISAHLRGRNRRGDRHIAIPYLNGFSQIIGDKFSQMLCDDPLKFH